MAFTIDQSKCLKSATVTLCVAVALVSVFLPHPSGAGEPGPLPVLEAELQIARGDLRRLMEGESLSPLHAQGVRERIVGAFGVLPWLLQKAGDTVGARELKAVTSRLGQNEAWPVRSLARQLDGLIERHPLNVAAFDPMGLSASQRREGKAIHDAYCAGCHDDAGQGDPSERLPARNLFDMAKHSPPEEFLARLINGVKGDETLLFANPLTSSQIAALWHTYQH